MATLKIKFVRHLTKLVNYVTGEMTPGDITDTHDCAEKTVAQDFQIISQVHHGQGAVNGIHVIQSWNKEESAKMTPGEVNAMGRELTEAHFPGHAFFVVTHTDTGNYHNHIVVNPWHSESGKKVENKKYHLYELRKINDTLCKARGLSVIDGARKEREARLPDKVQKMTKFNGKSWLLDMQQKAEFARTYATSHDQYVGIMQELGVTVRVEEKNISYIYGNKGRPKRGNKMGKNYDKPGLEAAYVANLEKVSKVPELRDMQQRFIDQVTKKSVTHVTGGILHGKPAATDSILQEKAVSAFTKTARPGRIARFPHELDVGAALIPLTELRRARQTSIFKYCEEKGIALEKKADGKMRLKGREFVELSEFEWVNKRNLTRGSLIELVAAHQNVSFLKAVATINGNPRLLSLEQHMGEAKRSFTSFYVPKEHLADESKAMIHAQSLLQSFGSDAGHARALAKSGQLNVTKEGRVRLFGKDDEGGAFEFVQNENKSWHKAKVGGFTKPFFAGSGGGKKLTVYLDPFSFMAASGKHAFSSGVHSQDVLCLMEPDEKIVLQHVAAHRHIKDIEIFTGPLGQAMPLVLDFFHTLKNHGTKLGIPVSPVDSIQKSRSRAMDLPGF